MGFFSGLRRRVKKLIPKEVRPFVPYAAAMIPGIGGLAGGYGKFANAALARMATDDEANLKDVLRAGTFAAAPNIIDAGIGGLDKNNALRMFLEKPGMKDGEATKSIRGMLEGYKDPSGFKDVATVIGTAGTVDAGIKAAELNEDALAKYNAEMAAQGIGDRKARRAAIRAIYEGTGTWDMDEVDDMLDTYGYRTGGRVGYEDGDAVDGDVDRILKRRKKKTTSMKDLIKDTILGVNNKEKDSDLEDSINMMSKSYKIMYPEIEPASIRPLSFEDGGSVDDRLMERVKELQDEGLDFASALAQAMKEDMAANKARGGIMDGIDVNMREQIDTPRGDMMIDENMEVADSSLMDAYEIYKFDMMEQGLEPMSIEEFRDQAMAEGQMASADMDIPIQDLADEFEITFKRKPNSLDELKEYYKQKYEFNGDISMMEESQRTMAAQGGLMSMGGNEMDLRGGGFVPMGKAERADDVPARLSKNEFVMTADAVRAAGGGSVQKGADLMYDQMKQLEGQA